MSIFEQASRLRIRYDTPAGLISVEDLWDIPLTSARGANLNSIAISLHSAIEERAVSFVEDTPKISPALQLKFDVIKHVIEVLKTEKRAAWEASAKAARKQKLLSILARKQDEALENMSEEDIKKLIDETA